MARRPAVKLPRLAGQPGQGGLVQQGTWMEAVRLLEEVRFPKMDFWAEEMMDWTEEWREALVRVERRVAVRRILSFIVRVVVVVVVVVVWCGVVFVDGDDCWLGVLIKTKMWKGW
jgi:hypothetical protein